MALKLLQEDLAQLRARDTQSANGKPATAHITDEGEASSLHAEAEVAQQQVQSHWARQRHASQLLMAVENEMHVAVQ